MMDDQTFQALAAKALAGKCSPEETARLKEALAMNPERRDLFGKLRAGRQALRELLSLLDPAPCATPELPEHLRGLLNAEVRRRFPGKPDPLPEASKWPRAANPWMAAESAEFRSARFLAFRRDVASMMRLEDREDTARLMDEARKAMAEAMPSRAEAEAQAKHLSESGRRLRDMTDHLLALVHAHEQRLEQSLQAFDRAVNEPWARTGELTRNRRQELQAAAAALSQTVHGLRREVAQWRSPTEGL